MSRDSSRASAGFSIIVMALLSASAFGNGTPPKDPKPHDRPADPGPRHNHRTIDNSRSVVANNRVDQSQSSQSQARSTAVVEGDDYDDYPVASSAVIVGSECAQIANASARNLSVGFSNRDSVCQWQDLAREARNAAASIQCELPPPANGKGLDGMVVDNYGRCLRAQSEASFTANSLSRMAVREKCAVGIGEFIWKIIGPGLVRCDPALYGGQPRQP